MSEMRGVDTTKLENEQAQTTQGLAVTTASIRQMDGTISSGNQGTHSRLDAIARVLSIESPDEKQAREQAAEAARAAEARFDELISLQQSGNATDEQVLDAQRAMEEAQREENERSERRSNFDRLAGEDGGPPPPPPGSDSGGDDGPGFFEKTFGKFFKLLKGIVGVLLAVAIPALAFLLNSPVFEKLKEALFNFIDYIFDTVIPFIQKEIIPRIKEFYEKFLIPIKDFIMDFLFMEGGALDITLAYLSNQWENVKKLFNSMLDLFDNLMSGNFEKAFGNLGDIGSTLMDAIDEGLTAILKLGLAAFGLSFDGTIGDMIGNWLTSTWESIKSALRGVFEMVGLDAPEMLQAGDAEQRERTSQAEDEMNEARRTGETLSHQLRRSRQEEETLEKKAEAERAMFAKLQAKAEAAGGEDKLSKERGLLGLGASDFEAFQNAKAAVERREKEIAQAKARSAEIEKERDAAKARFEKALKEKETVEKEIAGETVKRDEAGRIKRISPAEEKTTEQVNQAAVTPQQPPVVVQNNDNRQNQSNEQKTVIEHNKELNAGGSAGLLSRAVETTL